MLIILAILFISYLFFLLRYNKHKPIIREQEELKISIIVAAKNEEQNIPSLIHSLNSQNYSKNNYEIIIVDDNSSDSTYSIASQLISDKPNFKIIKAANKIYNGKRGALQIGIENSINPYILITDADCKPIEYWVKSYSNKFTIGYDFLFGIAPYSQINNSNIFFKKLIIKIACYDNLWVHILTFGFARAGIPYSSAARSFGFKKDSFNKIKGYSNTLETLSGDDDLLLREAVKAKLKIGHITNIDAFVFTNAKETLKEFINQKSRHTSTSNYYTPLIKIIVGSWYLINQLLFWGILLSFFNIIFLYLFFLKIIGNMILSKLLMSRFSYKFNLIEVLYLQFINEFLLLIFYLRGSFYNNKW